MNIDRRQTATTGDMSLHVATSTHDNRQRDQATDGDKTLRDVACRHPAMSRYSQLNASWIVNGYLSNGSLPGICDAGDGDPGSPPSENKFRIMDVNYGR